MGGGTLSKHRSLLFLLLVCFDFFVVIISLMLPSTTFSATRSLEIWPLRGVCCPEELAREAYSPDQFQFMKRLGVGQGQPPLRTEVYLARDLPSGLEVALKVPAHHDFRSFLDLAQTRLKWMMMWGGEKNAPFFSYSLLLFFLLPTFFFLLPGCSSSSPWQCRSDPRRA